MRLRTRRAPIFLLIGILAAGCDQAPRTSPAATTPGSPGVASPGPTGSASAPATSATLIAAALAGGTITEEQSLLYRALALYASPGLPEAFRSPVPDMGDAMDLFAEIDQKEASLSAAALAQLAPYRARPSHPISIFNAAPAVARSNVVLAATTPRTWASLAVGTGYARVWVQDSPNAATRLAAYAAAVATVWAALPEFFTYPNPDEVTAGMASVNPDPGIDLYFAPVGNIDPRRPACLLDSTLPGCVFSPENNGYAQRETPFDGAASSGYVVIDEARTGDELLGTVAHELAHAGQFAYDRFEASWLMESTATWVEHQVLKKLGRKPTYPYAFLQQFFADLDLTLTRLDDSNAYASWLYFLFASMELGDSAITSIWEAAAANGIQGENAVDSVFEFEEHFDDFSVRNWNRDPVERQYRTNDDTFPSGHQPEPRNDPKTLAGGEERELDAKLPALASAYYDYVITPTARTITFENKLFGVPGAHVWAIRNVNETWQRPEDWTDVESKEFCRDVPEQDVGQLILIVSNSKLAEPLVPASSPRLIGRTSGCGGWRGTITSEWNYGNVNARKGSLTATVLFEADPVFPEQFIVTEGAVAWSETGSSGTNCTLSGAGSYSLVVPGDDLKPPGARAGQLRIWDGGDPGELRYSGIGHTTAAVAPFSTLTCDGLAASQQTTDARNWLAIGSSLPPPEIGYTGEDSLTFARDARSFSGTYTHRIEGQDRQTWTWTFVKVGE